MSTSNWGDVPPLDLSLAHKIVASWPQWKRELAQRLFAQPQPPGYTGVGCPIVTNGPHPDGSGRPNDSPYFKD